MSDGGGPHIQVKPLDPLLHVLAHVVEIAEVAEALELVVFQQGAEGIVVGSQHIGRHCADEFGVLGLTRPVGSSVN